MLFRSDMQLKTNVMHYAGDTKAISAPSKPEAMKKSCSCGCVQCRDQAARKERSDETDTRSEPDFSKMTSAEKVAYHKARWDRILG